MKQIIQKIDRLRAFAPTVLRVALSLVFLWFGFTQLQNAIAWVPYVPDFVQNFPVSAATVVFINGLFEVLFGSFLLFGIFARISALLLGLHLLGIAFFIGLSATGVRDFGLSFATLSIFLSGGGRWSLDNIFAQKETAGRRTGLGKALLVLILLLFTAYAGFQNYDDGSIEETTSGALPALTGSAEKGTPASSSAQQLSSAIVDSHNSAEDCWLIIRGRVYDVASFIGVHPVGAQRIIENCGSDATSAFGAVDKHAKTSVQSLLSSYYIGNLDGTLKAASAQANLQQGKTAASLPKSLAERFPGAQIIKTEYEDDGRKKYELIQNGVLYKVKVDPAGNITKIEKDG